MEKDIYEQFCNNCNKQVDFVLNHEEQSTVCPSCGYTYSFFEDSYNIDDGYFPVLIDGLGRHLHNPPFIWGENQDKFIREILEISELNVRYLDFTFTIHFKNPIISGDIIKPTALGFVHERNGKILQTIKIEHHVV